MVEERHGGRDSRELTAGSASRRQRELTVKSASVRKSPKPGMPQRHSSNMATHSSPFQTILQIGYQVFKHRSLGRSFSFTLPHTPASQIQALGAHFLRVKPAI